MVFLRTHEVRRAPRLRLYDLIVREIVGNIGGVRPQHEQLGATIGHDLDNQPPQMRLAPSVRIRFKNDLVAACPSCDAKWAGSERVIVPRSACQIGCGKRMGGKNTIDEVRYSK